MLIGGLIFLLLGWFLGISILLWVGVILLVIGAVFAVAGSTGHAIGGRRHYY